MSQTEDRMDVGYVAKLARIDLTEEERALFQTQLNQVLGYVEQLNELDVESVDPTAHAFPVFNVLREDVVGKSLNQADVIANAPATTQNEIRVPKIIEQ